MWEVSSIGYSIVVGGGGEILLSTARKLHANRLEKSAWDWVTIFLVE